MGCMVGLDEEQKKILAAIKNNKDAAGSKEIAESAGMTTAQVTCRLRGLKRQGYLEAPERGKYKITSKGKTEISK